MDRSNFGKVVPLCPRNIAIVDQYMWNHKDTNVYPCMDGMAVAIYDCTGNVNFALPLDKYPRGGQVHPELYPLEYATRAWDEVEGSHPYQTAPQHLRLVGRQRGAFLNAAHALRYPPPLVREGYGAQPPGLPLDARTSRPYGLAAGTCINPW